MTSFGLNKLVHNVKFQSINILWIVSSIAIRISSELQGSSSIIFLISSSLCFLFFGLYFYKKKPFNCNINILFYSIGCMFLIGSGPVFENDHYRYLWEGKVLLNKMNPYQHPPNAKELEFIQFKKKSSIAFKMLTSIYPPISQVVFTIVAPFKYPYSLYILQFLFSLSFYFLLQHLIKIKINPFLITMTFPLIQKEFLQSCHIDLLALCLFVISYNYTIKTKWKKSFLFWNFSFWTKSTSILSLPFIIIYYKKKEKSWPYFYIMLSLIPILFFLYYSKIMSPKYTGAIEFMKYWVWNAGMYNILFLSGVHWKLSRIISIILYLILYIIIILKFLHKSTLFNKDSLSHVMEFTFLSLMFFSPVYNPWYTIWAIYFSLKNGHTLGIVYLCLSVFSYIQFTIPKLPFVNEFFSHFLFLFIIYRFFKKSQNFSIQNIKDRITKES